MWLYNTSNVPIFDDFLGRTANGGSLGWSVNNTGASATTVDISAADVIRQTGVGFYRSSTGTTATGASAMTLASNSIVLSSGTNYTFDMRVGEVNVIANGANDYYFMLGIGDQVSSAAPADQNNGVYFLYDYLISANWIARTANGGVRTSTTSSTAVSASAMARLSMVVTGTTSVEFFVNDVSIGTHTTNIPTTYLTPFFMSVKRVGTAARTIFYDYYSIDVASNR